jgi:phosphomevalonate kinase
VAPGKVVLLGEDAVLDGAPAIVAAVDRGVACDVSPAAERSWSVPGGDDRFVAAALHAAEAPAGHYTFSDYNPPDLPTKAGLGGSAAATACAVAAARAMRNLPDDPAALHALAARVHHDVQGSGSGIDVAAACHGGVLRFQEGAVTPLPPITPTVVFSGTSARTGPRIDHYLTWPDRGAFVARSSQVVSLWAEDPVEALREGARLLTWMTWEAGVSYWTEGLRELVELAEECGGGAKPSGAGGGDVVVALFPDPARDAAFRTRCADLGFQVIPTHIHPGARRVHG